MRGIHVAMNISGYDWMAWLRVQSSIPTLLSPAGYGPRLGYKLG